MTLNTTTSQHHVNSSSISARSSENNKMMSNSNPNSRSLNSNVRSSSSLLPPYTPQNPFRLDNVKNPWNPPGWKTVRSTTTAICGSEITDDILLECVSLFNNNFGVWSEVAEKLNQRARAGLFSYPTSRYISS